MARRAWWHVSRTAASPRPPRTTYCLLLTLTTNLLPATYQDRRFPSTSPEEAALLVGGKEATPWRLLQGSDDSEVQELVAELMEKSERLKAAAIAPDNLRAAVAGLRLPRPSPNPTPTPNPNPDPNPNPNPSPSP
jgi:hypothetical protein